MKKIFQVIIQVSFLVLFIFLFVKGKVQLWMGLFLMGIVASFLIGRLYCGWFCSINTVMNGVTWIKRKLHIKSLKIPQLFSKPFVRYISLGLFIAVFFFTIKTGKKLPVLPALFLTGIVFTFFYPEELWHRYLCPYGTILSLPATKSKYFMNIDEYKCNNCGACKRICPAKAIEKDEKQYEIIKKDCLLCMKCSRDCKQDAISYIDIKKSDTQII